MPTVYKGELSVGTTSVVVSTGTTVTANIADTATVDVSLSLWFAYHCLHLTPSTPQKTTYIWQIGDFDGTPSGFLNADKIETMHPSDSRMSSWGPITFTVGNSISSFPMALFKAVGTVTIKSNLSSSQIGGRTLKIATTLAFAGGRPSVTVNGWAATNPAAPNQPDSRGVTRGTYRGNNIEYTYAIRTSYCFIFKFCAG